MKSQVAKLYKQCSVPFISDIKCKFKTNNKYLPLICHCTYVELSDYFESCCKGQESKLHVHQFCLWSIPEFSTCQEVCYWQSRAKYRKQVFLGGGIRAACSPKNISLCTCVGKLDSESAADLSKVTSHMSEQHSVGNHVCPCFTCGVASILNYLRQVSPS